MINNTPPQAIESTYENPASSCMRTLEWLVKKHRTLIEASAEQEPPPREAKARAVLRDMDKGITGPKACFARKVHATYFRRKWFPKGYCIHPEFPNLEWHKRK